MALMSTGLDLLNHNWNKGCPIFIVRSFKNKVKDRFWHTMYITINTCCSSKHQNAFNSSLSNGKPIAWFIRRKKESHTKGNNIREGFRCWTFLYFSSDFFSLGAHLQYIDYFVRPHTSGVRCNSFLSIYQSISLSISLFDYWLIG